MSAQLKMVIDRFYSYTTRISGKGLKAALIAATWDSGDDVMPYLAEHYKKLCRYMNFTDCGQILGIGYGNPSITKNSRFNCSQQGAFCAVCTIQYGNIPTGENQFVFHPSVRHKTTGIRAEQLCGDGEGGEKYVVLAPGPVPGNSFMSPYLPRDIPATKHRSRPPIQKRRN